MSYGVEARLITTPHADSSFLLVLPGIIDVYLKNFTQLQSNYCLFFLKKIKKKGNEQL